MKFVCTTICALSLLLLTSDARSATFDALKDYSCTETIAGTWAMEGYRAEDGAYLSMEFGRAPLAEVSKYGIDAYYLPDGRQPYYPFFSKFGDDLICSPAGAGAGNEAVLTWVAAKGGLAVITGYARLMGDVFGNADGKKVAARLMVGGAEVWSGEVAGGSPGEFRVEKKVSAGDKVRLHIRNAGDASGNITSVNMHVETSD